MEYLTATVGQKGQAVIPKTIRDRLGIRPGDELRFSVHERHIHVEKRSDDDLLDEIFADADRRGDLETRTPAQLKRDLQEQYDA